MSSDDEAEDPAALAGRELLAHLDARDYAAVLERRVERLALWDPAPAALFDPPPPPAGRPPAPTAWSTR